MCKHKQSTDAVKKVSLASGITGVTWDRAIASPGERVGLSVATVFVGDRSKVEVEVLDRKGKRQVKKKGKILANACHFAFEIPKKATDDLIAEAKLPKHGAKGSSGLLKLEPVITIKDLKWNKKEVRRGERVKLSAKVEGAQDGEHASVTILEHDADGAHDQVLRIGTFVKKGKVSVEWYFQYYDDVDDIATEEEAQNGYHPPEYMFRVQVRKTRAESDLLKFKDWIDIELVDEDGDGIPKEPFVLVFADGTEKKGKLDKHGRKRIEDVPPGPVKVEFPELDEIDLVGA